MGHLRTATQEELIQFATDLLDKDKELYFFEDLAIAMGYSKSWFYKQKLHEVDVIKDRITRNNSLKRKALRRQWADPAMPGVLQLSLYKILGTNEERRRLSTSYQEVDGKIESTASDMDFTRLSDEELDQYLELNEKLRRPDDTK